MSSYPDARRRQRARIFLIPVLWVAMSILGFAQDGGIRLAAIPEDPRPGDPVTVGLAMMAATARDTNLRVVLLNAQGQRLSRASFFNLTTDKDGTSLMAAILAVPSTARPGSAVISVESGSGSMGTMNITIGSRDFVSEEIALDQDNTNLRTLPDPKKTAEANTLWAILSRTGTEVYTAESFKSPVTSTRRTSFFGDRRVFKYVDGSRDTSIHAGIDYGVPTGTEVRACAPGKVVLARSRIVTGNSVIIEHLPGVYSLYYHLDKIAVSEGSLVLGGDLVGQSGSTGLATGPHLHWEIRVAGENTDPDACVAHAILDKDAIVSKLIPVH
ncbi:MAG: M23 family metallopeptidase [Treponema sp.]|nr:M23 family metallopeptidase [Treponema sp.]